VTPEGVLRRLEWHVLRRLDGRLLGDHRSPFRGIGIDFRDLREYEPGDDVRHIDWNVTARMDAPYIRQYMEDRDLTAWLVLDRSPSMSFGPADRPKQVAMTEIASALARLLVGSGNRVGAILYDNAIEQIIPPHGGRSHVLHLTRELLREPRPSRTVTDLGALFEHAARMIKRRSLVIVLSDFISAPGWEHPLALLNLRHEVVAILLSDPAEWALPEAGLIVVEDAETGEQLYVDTSDPEFRARLAEAGVARAAEIRRAAAIAGVDLHSVSTAEDLLGALVRITELRKHRRR
jgi:uncharacterized protein (DUF58 family)